MCIYVSQNNYISEIIGIDVVALTGVVRVSLGICASSSGGIAGQLLWKEVGGNWEDCTLGTAGKRVTPGFS